MLPWCDAQMTKRLAELSCGWRDALATSAVLDLGQPVSPNWLSAERTPRLKCLVLRGLPRRDHPRLDQQLRTGTVTVHEAAMQCVGPLLDSLHELLAQRAFEWITLSWSLFSVDYNMAPGDGELRRQVWSLFLQHARFLLCARKCVKLEIELAGFLRLDDFARAAVFASGIDRVDRLRLESLYSLAFETPGPLVRLRGPVQVVLSGTTHISTLKRLIALPMCTGLAFTRTSSSRLASKDQETFFQAYPNLLEVQFWDAWLLEGRTREFKRDFMILFTRKNQQGPCFKVTITKKGTAYWPAVTQVAPARMYKTLEDAYETRMELCIEQHDDLEIKQESQT